MNKLTLIIMAVATMTAGRALGADIPMKAPVLRAPPVAASYNWSGVYGGFGIGGAWTDPDRFYPNLPQVGIPATTFTSHGSDAIYSFLGGAQWQWGPWVFGAEVAYTEGFDGMKSSVSVSPPEPFTNLASTTDVAALFTIGPRIGYAWDRVMAYGTGGYAAARLKGTYSCNDTGLPVLPGPGACSAIFGPVRDFDFGGNTWNDGWFVGGGVEYAAYRGALADIILGAEYQHFEVDLKQAFVCTPALCGPLTHQNFLHGASGDIVRARLTVKTHGWGMW